MSRAVVGGIFVGGASTRMHGRPKGLLESPDGGTIVDRTRRLLVAAGVTDVVLVGALDAYAHLGVEAIADTPPGIGPLGGLVALLRRAAGGAAIAVACDMPFVTPALVARLLAAPTGAVAVAPRRAGHWEPLCARYDADAMRPLAEESAQGADHSLQRLLDRAGALALDVADDDARALADWDTPDDVTP